MYFKRVLYKRINSRTSLVECVSMRSGRLSHLYHMSDPDDIPTRQVHARVGFVNVSTNVSDKDIDYIKSIDTATFLPCELSVKKEIASRIAEGSMITSLKNEYIGRLPFPPHEVIQAWAKQDKDFALQLAEAKKHAARVRFEEALRVAHEFKDDPKTLKTYVDILKRHAEIDDPDTFNVKPDNNVQQITPVVNIFTGVPQPQEKAINASPEVIEHG